MNINLNTLIKSKLSLNKILILYSLKNDLQLIKDYEIDNFIEDSEYKYLLRYNFINESNKITEKGIALLNKIIISDNNKNKIDWVIEWRNLFPKGVKTAGYPVRSNLIDIEKKMNNFIKKHKYDKEIIFKATEKYINDRAKQNFTLMKTGVNFIEKDNQSVLADYCESIINDTDNDNFNNFNKQA